MPVSGSQIILCDLPLRFDTYEGCSHACSYCFVKRKNDISNIRLGESPKSLLDFINGKRSNNTKWADFKIPIHWGGMSDPFQPAEKVKHNSLECLKIFAQTKYPFVVSTKNKMIAQEPYLSLLKQCDCVVQISAACSSYDDLEMGASTFAERMNAAKIISDAGIRVNIRVQPYIPSCFEQIYSNLAVFKESGVHGVIFESMKYQRKHQGCIKIGGDFVYPSSLLQSHFTKFKNRLHQFGMKFYCGENRLRQMSDELCCCGVEGMGWIVNTSLSFRQGRV